MDAYLEILKDKANNIGANIEACGYDKECIANVLALKVRTDLENKSFELIKEKAIAIGVDIKKDGLQKEELLNAIELKIKETLEKENELHSSIEAQKNFMPIDLG